MNIARSPDEQPATSERKQWFGTMGDIRAGISVSVANVEGFLSAMRQA
ncbi:hypothetical protein [Paramagnetospirillum kuznetsovii]|nr:hypothetical protein [Paramagnetospirillum kuznetsovii]